MSTAVKIYKHFETPKKGGVYHRLVCLTGDDKGKAYYITGKRVVLGRSEKCDITILDIKSSREHAEIILVGPDYILTDLGSQNGIIVNDLKIKQHVLNDGDKVIVGKTVYKFAKIVVKEEEKTSTRKVRKKKKQEDDEEEEEPENKKMTMMLGGLAVLGVLLILLDGGESEEIVKKPQAQRRNVKEIDDSLLKAIKQRAQDNKKNKEKLALYFKRGLREYREGNYFRAIAEFENAQQQNPNDPLANFYLRKTRESLDEQIESYFSQAIRDADSVNYQKSVTSYCTIIRILNNYKTDERYISAQEGIRDMEKKLGLDEGEIECINKGDSSS